MRKIILTLIVTLTIMIPVVKAEDITSLSASETKDGVISVTGTVDNSVIATAILVYDEAGTNLVTMQTVQVEDDNTFSTTITLPAKAYVVKVANYSGGEYKTLTVSPTSNSQIQTPNTLDNIVTYIIVAVLALASIIVSTLYLKNQKSH